MDNFFVTDTNGNINLKDLSSIVERLDKIETDLSSIVERLDKIETRIKPNGNFQIHDREYSGD